MEHDHAGYSTQKPTEQGVFFRTPATTANRSSDSQHASQSCKIYSFFENLSFLGHHIVCICNLSARTKHLRETLGVWAILTHRHDPTSGVGNVLG